MQFEVDYAKQQGQGTSKTVLSEKNIKKEKKKMQKKQTVWSQYRTRI